MKYKRSFTLLETIVAIYVLLLGLVAAITLSSQSLSIVQTFKQELIATNLAQEGIELIRNKRDSNYLTNLGCVAPCDPNTHDMDNLARSGIPTDYCDKRLPPFGGNPRGCYIDWRAAAGNGILDAENPALNFNQCGNPSSNCQRLAKEVATGFYGYYTGANPPAGWEATGFDRRIFMIYPAPLIGIPLTTRSAGLEDALVRVYVTWTDKFSGSRYILLETAFTAHLL